MTQILQVGNRTSSTADIIQLLAGYQMLPQLWREIIIDSAIAPFECTSEEENIAKKQFDEKNCIITEAERQAMLERYGILPEQLEAVATRPLRIEKFKQTTWGPQLESFFLTHKSQLDRVIYSLIRTHDAQIAQELCFRIQAGEQSFAECAQEYSIGPEAQTGGLLGPVELNLLHPALAKILSSSQPGQLGLPKRLGEWLVIVRLEKLIPAKLDESMRQRLLDSLFEDWLNGCLAKTEGGRKLRSLCPGFTLPHVQVQPVQVTSLSS